MSVTKTVHLLTELIFILQFQVNSVKLKSAHGKSQAFIVSERYEKWGNVRFGSYLCVLVFRRLIKGAIRCRCAD